MKLGSSEVAYSVGLENDSNPDMFKGLSPFIEYVSYQHSSLLFLLNFFSCQLLDNHLAVIMCHTGLNVVTGYAPADVIKKASIFIL